MSGSDPLYAENATCSPSADHETPVVKSSEFVLAIRRSPLPSGFTT
jgi:hypothetical protein